MNMRYEQPRNFGSMVQSALTDNPALDDYLGSFTNYGSPKINPMSNLLEIGDPRAFGSAAPTGGGGWFSGFGKTLEDSGFLGRTDVNGNKFQGWGGAALGVAQGLGDAFMGMKKYGLAKDTFNENKRQFALNYGAQQKMTNARLEDQQRARVASNAGAYQSVGDYMKKNGV